MQRVQSLEPARYRLAAAGLRQGALVAVEVGLGVEQHTARLLAVTAGAADLLNVAVHRKPNAFVATMTGLFPNMNAACAAERLACLILPWYLLTG